MSNPEKTSLTGAAGEGAAETETSVPVPEYEAEQYVLGSKNISDVRISVFRREFGFIRAYFKARPEEYWELQQKLNQGRYGITYDVYLTRGVVYAAIAGFLGALLGIAATWGIAQTGILGTLDAPLRVPPELSGIVQFVSANRVLVVGAIAALVGLILFATITWFSYYYYPYSVANRRGREMNIMLPHTIVYMYALSFGGMGLVEVLKRTAAAEDTYGEVSNELDMIVRDVEFFGNDLFTAIRNARNLTPSDPMEQFLDDLLTTLDSGGNMTAFFRDNSEKYMEEAQSEQETFLETLATLSEVFIVLFVAAPLFVIVMLMVMSFLGANTIQPLFVIIYAVVPLVMAAYFVIISVLSEPYKEPGHDVEVDEEERSASERVKHSKGYQVFQRLRARARLRDIIQAPVKQFKRNPTLSLYISVPAALIAMWAITATGYADLSIDAFLTEPFVTTTALAVVPFLIATVPFTLFHEANERRKSEVTQRLPDMLDILASANQMGVQLSKGFDLVSRNVTGYFATEIKRVRNDINWNHDVQAALLSLAARLQVPQLTRTCKILAEGSRSTGNLHRILDIAADDTRHRYRMKRDRKQELQTYTAIVIMGFLVYLGVIVVLDNSFLQVMINQFETGDASQLRGSPIGVDLASLQLYKALFYHSALIQGVGTGLISGKLASNQAASGLKYSIALVVLAVAVFALL